MKYAFFPGCVSQGGAPELYTATKLICSKLGVEIEEISGWTCCGAGVMQEKNQLFGDVQISGAKNAVLPILAATLLTRGRNIIQGVPKVSDRHDHLQHFAELPQIKLCIRH